MATRSDDSVSRSAAVTVALLSDDGNVAAWLRHLFALDKSCLFNCQTVLASHFENDTFVTTLQLIEQSDIVILDDCFAAQPFIRTLEQLQPAITHTSVSTASQPTPTTRVLVLLDDESIIAQVSTLATAARLGADQYLLKADISLRSLRSCIFALEPSTTIGTTTANLNIHQPSLSPTITSSYGIDKPLDEAAPNIKNTKHQHQLSVDLINQRIHISDAHLSSIFHEDQSMQSIDAWKTMLDAASVKAFEQLIEDACSYRAIEDRINLSLNKSDQQTVAATLSQIQINNDGKGRVAGFNATLSIAKDAEDHAADLDNGAGFDNLGDGKPYIDEEDALSNLTRSLPMICLLLDESGVIASVINADADIQLAIEFNVGQLLTDALQIESEDNLTEAISRTLNTAKPYQRTISCATPNGMRWLDTHITKLKGNSGLKRQVVWTAFDITSSRLSYQELLKKHDTLSEIINKAPIMHFQLDNAHRFINANNAFCETYQLRADIIAGRSVADVLDDSALRDFLEQPNNGAPLLLQYQKSNEHKAFDVTWQALAITSTGSGTLESTIAFGIAIPVQADEHNLHAKGDEQGSGDNKVTAISSAATAEKPGIALSGAAGQDFKIILNSIVGYTELALSQKNAGREAKFGDYIDQVIKTAQHAKRLLDDCDSEPPSPTEMASEQITATRLLPLTEEVIETLRPTLPSTLHFESNISEGEDSALVNPGEYRRIVLRLLAGARDDAAKSQANNAEAKARGISMTLTTFSLSDQPCDACDQTLDQEFIALAVHSKTSAMDQSHIAALVKAAKQATLNRTADNVVAMTHHSDGHTLIRFENDILSLIMLFPKA